MIKGEIVSQLNTRLELWNIGCRVASHSVHPRIYTQGLRFVVWGNNCALFSLPTSFEFTSLALGQFTIATLQVNQHRTHKNQSYNHTETNDYTPMRIFAYFMGYAQYGAFKFIFGEAGWLDWNSSEILFNICIRPWQIQIDLMIITKQSALTTVFKDIIKVL